MASNTRYNFSEADFGPDFAKENMANFRKLIDAGISFTSLSMPMVGVSYLLRYLATRDFYYSIFLDMYSLPNLTKYEFWKLLLKELGGEPNNKEGQELLHLCEDYLKNLAAKHPKIVLIFNRFDQLQKEMDRTFLANIRSLRNVAPSKIVMIFTSNKPLYEIAPNAIAGANLNFYSQYLYFKPYAPQDLQKLLIPNPITTLNEKKIAQFIELSGGHSQLLQVISNCQKHDLLSDQFVKLQFKDMLEVLNYHQKTILKNISLGKKAEVDDWLLGVGLVKKEDDDFRLFTPLLEEYIRSNLPLKLSHKESKLFKLLRKHEGRIVPKDAIFAEVWPEDPEKASDWALDALIYRLRKNPTFSSQYVIEAHKKQGFSLIQI